MVTFISLKNLGASEMAQWIKSLTIKPDNMVWFPGTKKGPTPTGCPLSFWWTP